MGRNTFSLELNFGKFGSHKLFSFGFSTVGSTTVGFSREEQQEQGKKSKNRQEQAQEEQEQHDAAVDLCVVDGLCDIVWLPQ